MSALFDKRWVKLASLAISAALTALSVCFPNLLGPIEWVSMVPAILVLLQLCEKGASLRSSYLYGLFYFEIYFAVCFHWFAYLYPLNFTGIDNFNSVLVIITAIFGLSLIQALGSALIFLITAALSRLGATARHPMLYLALIPALFAIFEYSQTFGWWGVPWGRLALGQMYDLANVSTASLFGSYFVSAVIVLVNTGLSMLIFFARDKARQAKASAVIALLAISLNLFVGTLLYNAEKIDAASDETLKIALIQGNYSSTDSKVAPPWEMLNTYIELSEEAASEGAELILWPESSLPYHFTPDNYLGRTVAEFSEEYGVYVIVGVITYEEDGSLYNRMYLAKPDGTYSDIKYDKRHLVPFGEYVPLRPIISAVFPFLTKIGLLEDDMTPGDSADVFILDDGTAAGPLICFDSIYEKLARDTVKAGAQFFVLGTNDSWFSTSAAIYMHNNQARLRSIEFGRSTARCAITGTSTFITSSGDVTLSTEPFTKCYVLGDVTLSDDMTLYAYIGNLFIHLCSLFVLSVFAYEIYNKLSKRRKNNVRQDSDENAVHEARRSS